MNEFDIDALDDPDNWENEEAFQAYQDTLVGQFEASERAKLLNEKSGEEIGYWARHFLHYAYQHLGVTPPDTSQRDADEVVNELFPQKITIFDKEEARWAIPEMIEFWHFLEESYELDQAGQIIAVLKNAEANFPDMMVDPSRAGMAKSFMLMGQRSGYDMTNPAEQQQAMLAFNAMQGGERQSFGDGLGLPDFAMDDYPGEVSAGAALSKQQKVRKKAKKKQQKASKRKNRKKR